MCRHFRQGLACQCLISYHHVKSLCRKIKQGLVVHLRSDICSPLYEDFLPGRHSDNVFHLNNR